MSDRPARDAHPAHLRPTIRAVRGCAALLAVAAAGVLGTPSPAHAGAPAYYIADAVAQRSAVFRSAAEVSGPALEARNKQLDRTGSGLRRLDLAVALLGADASPELRAWTLSTRRQTTGESMRLQKHLDLLQADYAAAFGAAVQRAALAVGGGTAVVACEAPPRPLGMPGPAKAPCPGVDKSAEIAALIDKDNALASQIGALNAIPFPEVSSPNQAWPALPLTGNDGWVSLGAAAEVLIPARIAARQSALEAALAPLQPRITAGDATALDAAKAARATYDAALAADGAALRAALRSTLEKTKGAPAVGLCPSAPALGGCPGVDRTKEVLALLADNKTWLKASAALQGP